MELSNTIILMLDSRRPGGIESHVYQLAHGLKNFRKKVIVVFIKNYGYHPLREALIKEGIPTISLKLSVLSLWSLMRNSKSSTLHTHGYKAGIMGRIVAYLTNTPVTSTFHMGELPKGKLIVYDWLDRHTAAIASTVFSVSTLISKRLPIKSRIIDNFVNTRNLKISTGKQIAFVGRLSYEKGADYFLEITKRFPNQRFHIYGDGPEAEKLQSIASINTIFHGLQSNMSTVWEKIGLLVMPSRNEGLPLAALEAMARGIPVLASNVGALDQLVKEDKNGWLIPSGNMDDFSEKVDFWIHMSLTKRTTLKIAAQKTIKQRFSSDIVIPKLIKSYKEISY